jgi:hypothetical protein
MSFQSNMIKWGKAASNPLPTEPVSASGTHKDVFSMRDFKSYYVKNYRVFLGGGNVQLETRRAGVDDEPCLNYDELRTTRRYPDALCHACVRRAAP